MTPETVKLVQDSFELVRPVAAEAGQSFYARLFEIAPEVRPMFSDDISEQAGKLMTTLGLVVKGLTNLEAIVPVAENLARSHVAFGVKQEQYAPVGAALIDTLEAGLGDAFTAEVKAAWLEAYTTLSTVMINAAYSEETLT